ncbi:MAG: HEPN domain-containing protein [DPANN group archaeon]|nr:HEPN domain-containing protein [DPANN group archaeon]
MKKTNFLSKLFDEKKIQFVTPSKDIKNAYIQRSEESLSSAKVLFKIGNLKDSVALSYYSMYHCLLALLFCTGIKCKNHTASILILKEVFGLNNDSISKAKKERIDKQYYVDFNITQAEVYDTMSIAEDFITELREFIEKLNALDIKQYQNILQRILI